MGTRRSRAALLALALGMMWPEAARGDADRSRVAVSFTITAKHFTDNISVASKEAVEAASARLLAGLCRERFGFVDWTAVQDLAPGATVDARLAVALVGEPPGPSRTTLTFSVTVADQPLSTPELPPVLVYELWDDQPTHAPPELQLKLKQVLEERFRSDDFRRRVHEQFVRQVPLSRRVEVREGEKRLVVPVSWKGLQARPESVLRAVFVVVPATGGADSEGQIRLSPEGGVSAAGFADAVMCRILAFTFPAVTATGEPPWNDRIPGLLAAGVLKRMVIYMDQYQREASSGGVVDDPGR